MKKNIAIDLDQNTISCLDLLEFDYKSTFEYVCKQVVKAALDADIGESIKISVYPEK